MCIHNFLQNNYLSKWVREFLNFLPFNLKTNTAPISNYSLVDYCQILRTLRYFVYVGQPLKVNMEKCELCVLIKLYFFA